MRVCVCMCVCVCVCLYACVGEYARACVRVRVRVHAGTHACMHAWWCVRAGKTANRVRNVRKGIEVIKCIGNHGGEKVETKRKEQKQLSIRSCGLRRVLSPVKVLERHK